MTICIRYQIVIHECGAFEEVAVSDGSTNENITRKIRISCHRLKLLDKFCAMQLSEVKEDGIWPSSVFDFIFKEVCYAAFLDDGAGTSHATTMRSTVVNHIHSRNAVLNVDTV